jgi:hypothetical protein
MNNNTIYRLDIRYPANRGGRGTKFRLLITEDTNPGTRIVCETYVADKPSRADLRTLLAGNGLEAYGDLKIMNDGTLRTMAKKIS